MKQHQLITRLRTASTTRCSRLQRLLNILFPTSLDKIVRLPYKRVHLLDYTAVFSLSLYRNRIIRIGHYKPRSGHTPANLINHVPARTGVTE